MRALAVFRRIQTLLTNRFNQILQNPHPFHKPAEFLDGDLVAGGIPGFDIGTRQKLKTAPGKAVVARPCLDKPRIEIFGFRPKIFDPMRYCRA